MTDRIIAFDFDGVICNGLQEYFHSAWLGYQQIWPSQSTIPSKNIRDQFYSLRPVIETGWEMIVLIRALTSDISAHDIWQDWSKVVQQILEETQVSQKQLAKTLDQIRDQQISQDFDHWLSLHRFYDGMSESLMQLLNTSDLKTYIITTKEGRFVNKLLKQHQVDFPEDHIFGKEYQQPKTLILKQLCSPDIDEFWFIEDRLKTLLTIQQEQELSHIKLFLADWGYNIATEKQLAFEKGITVTNLKSWQEQLFQNFLNRD